MTSVKQVEKILPLERIIVERGEFTPNVFLPTSLKGNRLEELNKRQAILARDGYKCRCCGKTNVKFHLHHFESRMYGGDSYDNLFTLCESCHAKLHSNEKEREKIEKKIQKNSISNNYKDSSFMITTKNFLYDAICRAVKAEVFSTYGYRTKFVRQEILHLEKGHINDALCIALGEDGFKKTDGKVSRSLTSYQIRPLRHHNRKLHRPCYSKGGKRLVATLPTYVSGYRNKDIIKYDGKYWFLLGRASELKSFKIQEMKHPEIIIRKHAKFYTLVKHSSFYMFYPLSPVF